MRRLAVHESFGNFHEDVQRNDSAGVMPRITTSRLVYENNINDPHVKVTIAAG